MNKKIILSLILGLIVAFSVILGACTDNNVEPGEIPLGAFEVLSPAKDATNADINPRISWSDEPNAEKYMVSLSLKPDFSDICAEEISSKKFTAISKTLEYETKYYVRIYAIKVENGKDIALSYCTSAFTTQADHETPIPDYSVTRTIHDFEDFADTDALTAVFKWHTGGDPLVPTLAEGKGADGSTAMKLEYRPGTYGWSYATSLNPSNKKVWSGAKGIRLWVDGQDSGVTLTIRIGKRGYQQWSTSFKVLSSTPQYVSIPFSAFDDLGGGDGIWDMTGIVRLDIGCKGGSASDIYIDNITIGSDDLHSLDTRDAIATKTPVRMYEDFENVTQEKAISKWKLGNSVSSATLLTKNENTSMVVVMTGGTQIAANTGMLARFDFSGINGLRMKLNISTASTVSVRVRVGVSSSAYYEVRKKVDQNNSVTDMVCDFAASGSTTPAPNKNAFDYFEVYVDTACTLTIDDIEFYTEQVGSSQAAWRFDASGYDTDTELRADWNNNTKVSLGGAASSKTALFTCTDAAASNMQYKFGDTAVHYHHIYAIKLKYTATGITALNATINNGSQANTMELNNSDGEHEVVIYITKMSQGFTITNIKFLIFSIQGVSGSTVEFSNIEFLVG